MIDDYSTSSVNQYVSSYHKLSKTKKHSITQKLQLPPFHGHLFIKANINTVGLRNHLEEKEGKKQDQMPIFTLPPWHKLKQELKIILKKMFLQKLKEVNQGSLLILNPGESINIRADCFCLSPYTVYTILIPLQKCDMQSCTIAVSEQKLKWEAQTQGQLLQRLQGRQFGWEYTDLEQGDLIIIGRDCVYGSFRNDSPQPRHFIEIRWLKNDQSSSSSNSS